MLSSSTVNCFLVNSSFFLSIYLLIAVPFIEKVQSVILAHFKFSQGLQEIVPHWPQYMNLFSKNLQNESATIQQIILTVNHLSQNGHKKCNNFYTSCLAFRKIYFSQTKCIKKQPRQLYIYNFIILKISFVSYVGGKQVILLVSCKFLQADFYHKDYHDFLQSRNLLKGRLWVSN